MPLGNLVDKKATAVEEAVRSIDKAHKYKGMKANLEMRKQELKERQYKDEIMTMNLATLSPKDVALE